MIENSTAERKRELKFMRPYLPVGYSLTVLQMVNYKVGQNTIYRMVNDINVKSIKAVEDAVAWIALENLLGKLLKL